VLIEVMAGDNQRQAETIQQLLDGFAVLKGEKAKPHFETGGLKGKRVAPVVFCSTSSRGAPQRQPAAAPALLLSDRKGVLAPAHIARI